MNPDITLGAYITDYWLPVLRRRVEPYTAASYETDARNNLPAELKAQPLATIRRGQLKRLLGDLMDERRLAVATVAKVANVLRSIFASAVDDEMIAANPADRITRTLGLRAFHVENIKSMTADQLGLFLAVAKERQPAYYVELAILAFTGIRIGELRGLQIGDLDFPGRVVSVVRQVHEDGSITGPKGRRGARKPRKVDMADELAAILEPYIATRRRIAMKVGSPVRSGCAIPISQTRRRLARCPR